MESEPTPLESNQDSHFKKYLCRVTPLSRYLALALFIALPFIGGYVGYQLAPVKVVEVGRVVETEKIVEVGNEEGIDDNKKPTLEDLVSCYDSKDYFVIQSRDLTNKNIVSYVIKPKANYPEKYIPDNPMYRSVDYFHDCLRVYETGVGKDDITLETIGPINLYTFTNDRMYFDGGTDKIRSLEIYDLNKANYVLEDDAWNLDEMETSTDFVRYWSLAKSANGPDTEFMGACLGVEDYIFHGEFTYIEYNFETGEEIVLDEKCI